MIKPRNKGIFAIISTIALFTCQYSNLNTHASEIDNWNWQAATQKNDNQYWEMFQNHPVIQKLDAKRQVKYYIETKQTNKYFQVWQQAIKAYNQLDVIKLIPSTKSQAQIILRGEYSLKKAKLLNKTPANRDLNGNSGITYNKSSYTSGNKAYFLKSICTIATHISNDYNLQLCKYVAQHELGHALGFDHNPNLIDGKTLIMNGILGIPQLERKDYPKPIGEYEKQLLIDHYGPNPNIHNQKINS